MIKSSVSPGVSKRKAQDAKKSITITVKKRHHKNAVQCDGKRCVVAQAFDDSIIGEFYEGAEIGLSVTKLTIAGKILRFATPKSLVPYIREFDRTGVWNIPEGNHVFNPLSPSMRLGARENRWRKHRTNTDGSGRDGKFRAAPTRRISRVSSFSTALETKKPAKAAKPTKNELADKRIKLPKIA